MIMVLFSLLLIARICPPTSMAPLQDFLFLAKFIMGMLGIYLCGVQTGSICSSSARATTKLMKLLAVSDTFLSQVQFIKAHQGTFLSQVQVNWYMYSTELGELSYLIPGLRPGWESNMALMKDTVAPWVKEHVDSLRKLIKLQMCNKVRMQHEKWFLVVRSVIIWSVCRP